MKGMKRSFSIALAAGLTAALLAPSAAPAASSSGMRCAGRASKINESFLRDGSRSNQMEQVSLKTFHIEAKPTAKIVPVGDTIKVKTNVTRPAQEDPLGQGIPMDRPYVTPAEGVNVGVGLLIGDVFLPGFAITDENGDAVIKIKIERYVKPGPVDAAFYAWNVVQETPCATIQENGFRPFSDFFKVTR